MATTATTIRKDIHRRIDALPASWLPRVIDFMDSLEEHEFNEETIEAMEEAMRVSKDLCAKRYSSFSELVEEVREEMKNEI